MDHSFAERAAARRRDMVVRVARSREERRAFELERDRSLPPYRRAERFGGWSAISWLFGERMELNSDLTDLLRALNDAGAEYLIVGGYAFAVHGRVRATKDADIFVGTNADNAAKVWRALAAFGAPLDELRVADLTKPDTFFIMGRAPNQIDIITTIDGVAFEDAWSNRVAATYGGVSVHYIGRADLIANKEAADRPQDRLDVAYLRGEGTSDDGS
jgi:hypothetical protein